MSNELDGDLLFSLVLGVVCALLVIVGSDIGSSWVHISPGLASVLGFLGFTLPIVVIRLFWCGAWTGLILWKMGAGILVLLCLFVYLSVLHALADNQSAHLLDSFFFAFYA